MDFFEKYEVQDLVLDSFGRKFAEKGKAPEFKPQHC
jgi:hypothetical protein